MKTTWKIENVVTAEFSETEIQAEVIWTCDVEGNKSHICKTGISKFKSQNDVDVKNISQEEILLLCEQAGLEKLLIEQDLKNKIESQE